MEKVNMFPKQQVTEKNCEFCFLTIYIVQTEKFSCLIQNLNIMATYQQLTYKGYGHKLHNIELLDLFEA